MNAVLAIEMALVIVVPVISGLVVLWLARRTPSRFANPARTSLMLFVLLIVMAAFMSPGGDLVTPTVGGIVSAVVCAGVYIGLRRRRVGPACDPPRPAVRNLARYSPGDSWVGSGALTAPDEGRS